MKSNTDERLLEILAEMSIYNKQLSESIRLHNEEHKVTSGLITENNAMLSAIQTKLLYLLTISFIALAILAGAEKIIGIL